MPSLFQNSLVRNCTVNGTGLKFLLKAFEFCQLLTNFVISAVVNSVWGLSSFWLLIDAGKIENRKTLFFQQQRYYLYMHAGQGHHGSCSSFMKLLHLAYVVMHAAWWCMLHACCMLMHAAWQKMVHVACWCIWMHADACCMLMHAAWRENAPAEAAPE